MNYYLFRLQFDTPVHFGPSDSALSLYSSEDHFRADTLFSALCHESVKLWGKSGPERLCAEAEAGELLLSDAMPWKGERLFLPKPCASSEKAQDVPEGKRKAMKKLEWIPLDLFAEFMSSVRGGSAFDPQDAEAAFGISGETTHVLLNPGEDSLPYQTGVYRFLPDAGLWFIAGCGSEEQGEKLGTLIRSLGLSGIGGKVSSGYGKFSVDDCIFLNEPFDEATEWLCSALTEDADRYLLLSASLPSDGELERVLNGAEYRLERRSGFVQSERYATENLKKKTQYFLAAGSVLPCRYLPTLYSVGGNGRHPVYRLSAPIFLGVTL